MTSPNFYYRTLLFWLQFAGCAVLSLGWGSFKAEAAPSSKQTVQPSISHRKATPPTWVAEAGFEDPLLKEAERLFLEGQALARKAKYQEALAKFLASYRIVPSRTTPKHRKIRSTLLFLIGRTYQLQKKFPQAGLYYRKYLKVGKRERFRTLAKRFLKQLWPSLRATFVLQAAEGQSSEGVTCKLREPRGTKEVSFPSRIEVEAGELALTCTASGFLPFQRKLKVEAGGTQTLMVKLAPVPPKRREPPTAPKQRDLRWVAYVVGGLGLATVGVGGVFGGLSLSARAAGEDAIRQAEQSRLAADTRKVLEAEQAAQQHATTANVMFAVGGGVAIVGVILYFVLRPRKPSTRTQSRSSGAKVRTNRRMHSDETWSFSSSEFSIVVSP